MHRELNLFVLVQQIRKLKAGLSVLIGNNNDLIDESAKRYLEYSTIHLGNNKGDDEDYEAFNTFMERDETRFIMIRKFSLKLERQLSMMSSKNKMKSA